MKEYNILRFLSWLLDFVVLYIMLDLMWVGAEWIFEGAVHSSHIDGVVNGILAYYILRKDGSNHGY